MSKKKEAGEENSTRSVDEGIPRLALRGNEEKGGN